MPPRRATSRWRRLGVLAVLAAGACGSGSAQDAATTTSTTSTSGTVATGATSTTWTRPECPQVSLDEAGALADPALDEVSGAAASSRDPGAIWVIEDSGNPAVATALSPDGATLSSLTVTGSNTDWEDLAILQDGDSGTLFIGDIGGNAVERDEIQVLRVPEPDPRGGDTIADPDTLVLRLPSPADAEALLVDPVTGDVVVVTKSLDGSASVFVAAAAATAPDGATIELVAAGDLDLGLLAAVLAGDVAPDGSAVALRTPSRVLWWPRDPSRTVADTLSQTEPCRLPSLVDPYGEALALIDGGSYVVTGEGVGAPVARAD